MIKFKPLLRILPLLSIFGLSACLGSAVGNLLVTSTKLTPANPTIAAGATQPFVLVETFVGGTSDSESPENTTWASDNTAVATIDAMGVATGVAAGTVSIAGNHKGNSAKTLLTVTTPANVAIAVHGNSRILYVTNRRTGQQLTLAANGLNDSVSVSSPSAATPAFEISVLPEHGPAWLAVAPTGDYLYVLNQSSETISVFTIDWIAGSLHPVVSSPFPAGSKPLSVELDPDGANLSIAHFQSSAITRFIIDPSTGALAPAPR